MRSLLLTALLATTSVSAQTVGVSDRAHLLPFESSGNAIELTVGALLGDAPDSGAADDARVVVVSAPDWLRFSETAVPAPATDDGEHRALLSFDVARGAPVSEPAEVVLDVLRDGVPVATKTVAVEVEAPAEFGVDLPRPNPTRGAVVVPYDLPVTSRVDVAVYDLLGRRVLTVDAGERSAGAHEVRLDAQALAAGTYAVVVTADDVGSGARAVQRLVVVR
jgi:hypothetical protein